MHPEQDPVSSNAQAVMVSCPLQLLDVAGELLLQQIETMADIPAERLRESADLSACLFGNQQSIDHKSVYDLQANETIGSVLSSSYRSAG